MRETIIAYSNAGRKGETQIGAFPTDTAYCAAIRANAFRAASFRTVPVFGSARIASSAGREAARAAAW